MFSPQRDAKHHSHGHHLTPQDANAERTRRRRHRVYPGDNEQTHGSSSRGYRSDDEPRRRHRHNGDKDRYRASSSHHPKDYDRRKQDSSSDTEDDLVRLRVAQEQNVRIDAHHERSRSDNRTYGEHRFDDLLEERRIHPARKPTPLGISLPPLAHDTNAQIGGGHDEVRVYERVQLTKPHSAKLAYGDHREYNRVQIDGAERSMGREYGEHRFDDAQLNNASSMKLPVRDPRHMRNFPSLPPSLPNEASFAPRSKHDANRVDIRDGVTDDISWSPTDMPRSNRVSLPARVQDLASTSDERIRQDELDSRPSTAGHNGAFSANTKLPRLSISQYPAAYSQFPSNVETPGDSTSGVGEDGQRPRSAGAASNASSRIMSWPPSSPSSGVLGPKTYQYQPLQPSEIRLVKILPERMWKLKCEIVHVSLQSQPEYTAISYAWGDGVDTRPLILEGTTIPVAVSLHDALRAVRRKKEDIFVWVDALCIDQQNKDERATQVRLMGQIYIGAVSVAIWIGPEYEESALALQLLQRVAENSIDYQYIKSTRNPDSMALLNLFKRDYWKRLWVVQEVLLANNKMVYCGPSAFDWEVYQKAAEVFWGRDSDPHIRQGPSSFPDRDALKQLGDESLLEVMRACRKKLSEDPRDKVFGILGLLSDATQRDFPVDYSQSVKTVYTDVVDHLISTTERIDVIREAIHFPLHVNSTGLPSWCPDWSHIPEVSGLGRTLNFAASSNANGPTKAQYWFHDERRKLEISAIKIDTVTATGVAVGTFCAAQDYLTAFLQWRAMLLHELNVEEGNETHAMHSSFCRTLSLGQVPPEWSHSGMWHNLCYHVFAALIRERMPRLPMDEDLKRHVGTTGLIEPKARRTFLQDHFGNRMMGRSLCITAGGLIGMGSGYMTAKDIVVVPFGCSTPILLRPEGRRNEYRYVGDVYIDGYMHGEALAQMEARDPRRVVSKYMLC